MDWLSLSLLSAFSLATADAATKRWMSQYGTREITLVRFVLPGALLAPLLLLEPLPALPAAFWYWMAFLLPLEILAMLLYMRAIRGNPLSLTLPYLAFTPVFVVITGWVLLGEQISRSGLAGVLLVVAGAWLLNVRQGGLADWRSILAPLAAVARSPGSRTMLAVAFIYSLTSVAGKGAMRHMPPEQFGPFYFAVLGLVTLVLFGLHRPALVGALWRRPAASLAVGLAMAVMVLTHFLAVQRVEVAYMVAVKRTSLLFGILYGALWFGERGLAVHLLAGSLMVAGVFLIAV
ncbi:MAG: DMT family transporter [Chromatiales bacterium]|jgi:drug/metabolite transporter (DMT)-like permease